MDSNFLAVQGGTPSLFARKPQSNSSKNPHTLLVEPVNNRNTKKSVDTSIASSTNQSLDQDEKLTYMNKKNLARKSTLESYEDQGNNNPSRNNISHTNIDNTIDSKQHRSNELVIRPEKRKNTNSTHSNNDITRIPSNLNEIPRVPGNSNDVMRMTTNPQDAARMVSNLSEVTRMTTNPKSILSRGEKLKGKTKVIEVERTPNKTSHLDELNLNNIYSSMNYSSLIYIPEGLMKNTPSHRQFLFTSFNELTRKEKATDMELLEKIIQAENAHQFVHHDQQVEQNRVGLLSQKLEFNRHQKEAYRKAIDEKMRTTFLPLISNEKEAKEKIARMPKIRTYPSKRMMIQSMTTHQQVDNKQDDMPEVVDLQSQKAEFGKTISSHDNLTYSYQFFWYFQEKDNSNWKPSGRESCTLTTVGKHVVLYGGLSNNENDEIVVYDPIKKLWNKPKMNGEMPFYGRHGHTALEYKKCVIFFGGEKKYNETISLRECLNDTRSYNPEKNEWKFFKCIGKVIEPRRSHSAAIYDRTMFIYGGISSHGRYLNDLWSLNLKNNTWSEIQYESDEEEKGISFHAMCPVFNFEKNDNNKKLEAVGKVSLEGLYVFGGKLGDSRIINRLKVLLMDQRPFKWVYPSVKGVVPVARFKHSMLYYPPLNILIVYGGRNDLIYERQGSFCLQDIRVLNLELMSWCPAASFGDGPSEPRCSHSVSLFGNTLMLFGGMSDTKIADSVIRVLELNQGASRRLIRDFQHDNNQNELERRMMLEKIIMDKIKQGEEEERDNVLEKKREVDFSEDLSRPKKISYLPVPNQREDEINQQRKMRYQMKSNIARSKSQTMMLRIAALVGDSRSYGK